MTVSTTSRILDFDGVAALRTTLQSDFWPGVVFARCRGTDGALIDMLRRGGSGGGAPAIFCAGRKSWKDVGDVGDVHGSGAPLTFVCSRGGLFGMSRSGSSSAGANG